MKTYIKLVNFELGRFMKLYLVLIGITIISQVIGVLVRAHNYMEMINYSLYEDMYLMEEVLSMHRKVSMVSVVGSGWFLGPIAVCITALLFYVFFIWYRDWLGKNTFVYRLLMLPSRRLNLFLAKATAIYLLVWGLIATQLVLLPLENLLLGWRVPEEFYTNLATREIINSSMYLNMMLPSSFIQFLLNYGAGFMAVLIAFTAILFERSFRFKGILLGGAFSALMFLLFLSPLIFQVVRRTEYFYPIELLLLMIATGVVVTGISIWMGNFLLNRKVTV